MKQELSEYRAFREVRFFGSLDGLRAISILGVIWFHSWYQTPYYDSLRKVPVLRIGEFGVHFFFGISGFLITTLLLREQQRYGKIALRDFYIRRTLRIWPVYYATLAFYVVLVLVTEHGTGRGRLFFHYLPGYLTYTYTWFAVSPLGGPIFNFAWSLATEEQFYVFWPLTLKILRGLWSSAAMVALIAVHTAGQYGLLGSAFTPDTLAGRIVGSVAVPICLGALLAQALNSRNGFRVLYFMLGRKWSALAALGVLLVALYPLDPLWGLAWVGLTALVGACVIREDNALAPILRWRALTFIGVVSYGMYLFNTLAVKLVRAVLGHFGVVYPLLTFPVVVGLTVAVAFLSYRYFESPFLALKSRFTHSRRSPVQEHQAAEIGVAIGATPPAS